MLSINTNNASMAAVNAISKSSSSLSTSMERLATGNRINSSADDAAGKQIANRLTAQSSGMGVALSNINDATAMLQTADSMFDEMSDVLGRMKDLSTQAANGTYSDDDLQAMQDEYDELGQQMSDMLQNTTYGGTNLFGVSGTSNTGTDGLFQSAVTFQVGAESSDTMTVNISSQLNTLVTDLSAISNSFSADQADTTGTAGVSGGTELTASGSANQMITSISTAMDDVSQIQSKLGASINRLNDTANNLTSMQDNTEVAIGNIMDTDYATEASNMTKQQVLMQTGITLDSHGHLQIDSDQFNDEMAKNPDGLTSIFVGDNSMVAQMDDLINTYTDSSNGIITLRQQNIDDQMSKIQDEGDQLTDTYNANYDRYLEEYTNTLVEVYTMKASMAAFA
ncbi:lateral flagellin LafA [Escherichia coli]|nr:lateral flagellin LafA [Escherichia coli]EET2710568.1 lateral flagellin LafA [Escherichia coli]EHC4008895.1 lateral flagellin LafA [Escherichia coli]